MLAVIHNNTNIVRFLVENHANPTLKDIRKYLFLIKD
jgi:ankyrin repeat protein